MPPKPTGPVAPRPIGAGAARFRNMAKDMSEQRKLPNGAPAVPPRPWANRGNNVDPPPVPPRPSGNPGTAGGGPQVPPRPWNSPAETASARPLPETLSRPLPKLPVSGKPVQSRPYTPIRLARHPHCGTQSDHAVLCTEFARQAAERLFDDHGRFDRNAVDLVINDVTSNSQLPAHHRQNLLNTLREMRQNGKLVNTLESICAHPGTPLKGPAADLVRATLNLPPEQQALTPAHARKAATMALLGNLRQGKVGSCFATGPAICLHEGSRETVAKELKSLLETNKLIFKKNGKEFEMPLNKRVSTGDLDIEMLMRADGTCHGKALNYGNNGASYKLHHTPGMQAALTALGIPQPMMEHAVSTALQQMGMTGNTTYRLSKRSIIEHIARNHPNPGRQGNPLASALNAYAGKEDVRLLRAWEYTVAGAGEVEFQGHHIDKFSAAALFGADIPGRPDLGSLARHTGVMGQRLHADPRFRDTNLNAISTHLFSDIQGVMKDRFMLQYDADIKQSTMSGDGVSNRGGFVLYDRLPPNDPTKWVRIDDPKMFQQALTHAVGEAAQCTHLKMQGLPGHPQTNQAALNAYVQNLAQHIQTDAFTEFTARKMNPEFAAQAQLNLNQCENLPWKQGRGSFSVPVIKQYGAKPIFSSNIATEVQPNQTRMNQVPGQAPYRPDDATPVMDFIFNSMRKMEPDLKDFINKPGAKLPVGNSVHAFSLLPGSFKDALDYKHIGSKDWINHRLAKPSQQHVAAQRTQPPFAQLVGEMSATLRMTPEETRIFHANLAQRYPNTGAGASAQRYTLGDVHQELLKFCQSKSSSQRGLLYAAGDSVLSRLAPIPGVIIADTNWADDNGNPKYMLAVHNPFKNRVELHVADSDGRNRLKLDDKWIGGQWSISTPIGMRPRTDH